MKRYQLVRDVPGEERWANETFDGDRFRDEFLARGFEPSGRVGGDHLRPELRNEPEFTGLFGPTWGGECAGVPVVRYESYLVAKLLSE